jgi:hypothetical protein
LGFEQVCPNDGLESSDPLRQRRLRNVKIGRCVSEVTEPSDGIEIGEMLKSE